MYSKQIKEKKYSWGGKAYTTVFPAHGSVSIVGSVAGGERAWGNETEAGVHAAMLLEGTSKRSKKEIQIFLDSIGASLSFVATSDRLQFSAKVRAPHVEKLLELIVEALAEPAFLPHELAMLKRRDGAALLLEAQNPNAQAKIANSRLLFKRGHPNYSYTTKESQKALHKVSAKELQKRHAKIIDGRSLVVSLAGDIKPARAFALIEKKFKQLPRAKVTLKPYAKAPEPKAKNIVVHIPHKSSVTYILGIATRITKDHPDYAPLLLGVQVLGNASGFTGRLMVRVREKEGLTYGAYSYLPAATYANKADGSLEVWATFAPQLFEQGRAAVKREVRLIVEDGVTEEEVRKHRELFVAKVKVQLSNSGAFAGAAHDLGVEGRKISYLDELPKKVLKLNAKEVNKAIKKYILVDKLSESAAGPVEKLYK
ncbi:MAG: insulinase family protein [Patescibacteria group bacterium]|nr:insulinase family protein [Patescibacteria group bacterium]